MATSTLPSPTSASLGGISDSAPTGTTSGGGDSDLGSVLSSAYDEATGTTDASPVQTGDGLPDATPGDPGVQATPPQAGETAPPATEAAPTGDVGFPLSQDGKAYLVPKEALPGLQEQAKFGGEVGKWFASPEDAHASHLQASDLRQMTNDWVYGSPEALQGVMQYWSGAHHQNPAMKARFAQSFTRMAQAMPAFLKANNPQAYRQLVGAPARFTGDGAAQLSPASGLLLSAVEAAYARAAETGNPDDFKQAQYLDFGVTGQFKNELPKVDPQAAQMSQFEQQRRDFDARQSAALQRDVLKYDSEQLEGAKFGEFKGAIDKILAPVKSRYSETAFADLREGIHREVIDAIRSNPEFWVEHEQEYHQLVADYRTSWQQGNPGVGLSPRIASWKSNFMRQAARLLPAIAQKRIAGTSHKATTPKPTAATQLSQPGSAPAATSPQKRLTSEEWDAQWKQAWQ